MAEYSYCKTEIASYLGKRKHSNILADDSASFKRPRLMRE